MRLPHVHCNPVTFEPKQGYQSCVLAHVNVSIDRSREYLFSAFNASQSVYLPSTDNMNIVSHTTTRPLTIRYQTWFNRDAQLVSWSAGQPGQLVCHQWFGWSVVVMLAKRKETHRERVGRTPNVLALREGVNQRVGGHVRMRATVVCVYSECSECSEYVFPSECRMNWTGHRPRPSLDRLLATFHCCCDHRWLCSVFFNTVLMNWMQLGCCRTGSKAVSRLLLLLVGPYSSDVLSMVSRVMWLSPHEGSVSARGLPERSTMLDRTSWMAVEKVSSIIWCCDADVNHEFIAFSESRSQRRSRVAM